jgi:hypothetical protein
MQDEGIPSVHVYLFDYCKQSEKCKFIIMTLQTCFSTFNLQKHKLSVPVRYQSLIYHFISSHVQLQALKAFQYSVVLHLMYNNSFVNFYEKCVFDIACNVLMF